MQNPWINLPNTNPYVLNEDWPFIEFYNSHAKPEHFIHTELLPEPFLGTLDDAQLVLLNLNPGIGDDDVYWHERSDFSRESRLNLTHSATYPFYLLNPLFADSGGYKWWHKHLKEILEFQKTPGQGIMCIELFPYHSKKFKALHNTNLPDGLLPSQHYALYLVREAIKKHKLIVIMRRVKYWLSIVPELRNYNYLLLNSPMAASISQKNIAGNQFSRIKDQLSKVLSIYSE